LVMSQASEPVDWNLVMATGIRTAAGGPAVSEQRATEEVEGLREAAVAVREPVSAITGLTISEGPGVEVVDRAEWIRSNAAAMRHLLAAIPAPGGPAVVRTVGAKVAAVHLGLVFGWMSSKVLGQFEALLPPDRQPRLLLVAPNVLHTGSQLEVDPQGFRTWVCVHEETHRLQFAGVPWMAGHFDVLVRSIIADLNIGPGEMVTRLADAARSPEGRQSGISMLYSSQMRGQVSAMLGLMSLLEGHADWVMDQSGDIVPEAADLRALFDQRRRRPGLLDAVLRRLLGLEAKMNQYREGAAFVREVVAEVGEDNFNAVWAAPENLPTLDEIRDPRMWMDRVVAA
jgi:coenzyme F420 biosynthesis associated uncharacterized protein